MAHAALPRSPLAPAVFPDLPVVAGVTLVTARAGFKYRERDDFMLARFAPETSVAGVFTRSLSAAAPVAWCRAVLATGGSAAALVVTAGNANAFTGQVGEAAVAEMAATTAAALTCAPEQILIAQTGVIGQPFPTAKFAAALAPTLAAPPADWPAAARAIMTTDTFAKGAAQKAAIDGQQVNIVGIAKGSGMIAPDMATMLGFIFTDAAISGPVLQSLLAAAVDDSFNAITVDSDTSTNDTVLAFATGQAGHRRIDTADDTRLADFARALCAVCRDLAQQVVRDGEGASKFIAITVEGAASKAAAKRIAMAIANSPLVKTAIAGGDANWGRIVMAVGKAGEAADISKLAIWFGAHRVAADGAIDPAYEEAIGADYFKRRELEIRIDVGVGGGAATVWTCDLTHGYIAINADYRS